MIRDPALKHKIGNAAQIEEIDNWKVTFGNLQWHTKARWLTDESDHKRNKNPSMWPDAVFSVLCYFLAEIPKLKAS